MTSDDRKKRLHGFLKRIGERVRTCRQELGLSLEAAANLADMTSSHWGRIERCQALPSVEAILRVADALHTTVADLAAVDQPLADDHVIRELVDLLKSHPEGERADLLSAFRQIARIGVKAERPKRTTRKP